MEYLRLEALLKTRIIFQSLINFLLPDIHQVFIDLVKERIRQKLDHKSERELDWLDF